MISRIFAVLSAILLVGAFALATLEPPDFTLGQALLMAGDHVLLDLQRFMQAHLSDRIWVYLVVPMLLRPAWLPLAGLGLILFGISATAGPRSPSGSRRWRS
ncbi:MAG TPA: hypothetical protein VMI52_00280 [Acetobacteraceae bacterium]|nr:hypothetical protein [Acetobacteraceae bacterium]